MNAQQSAGPRQDTAPGRPSATHRPALLACGAALLAGAVVAGIVGVLGRAFSAEPPVVTAYGVVADLARSLPASTRAEGLAAAVNQHAGALPGGSRVLVWDTSDTAGLPSPGRSAPTPPAAPRRAGPAEAVAAAAVAGARQQLAASGDLVEARLAVGGSTRSGVAVAVAAPRRDALWQPAVLAGAAALVIVAATVLLASRGGPRPNLLAPRTERAAPPPVPAPPVRSKDPDSILVEELMDLTAQLPEGLAWRGQHALERVGVHTFAADGEAFDARRHRVVGVASGAPDQHGTVARTERPGYRAGDGVLRPALVVVYGDGAP